MIVLVSAMGAGVLLSLLTYDDIILLFLDELGRGRR
jgi:hypothetical protein